MTKINLLKHKGVRKISLGEFKQWLNEFIANKKGALPDFSDWKLIKDKLDTVREDYEANTKQAFGSSDFVSVIPTNLMDDLRYFQEQLKKATTIPETYKNLCPTETIKATLNGREIELEDNYDTRNNRS